MEVRPLDIEGALELTPVVHEDERGVFFESYRFEPIQAALGLEPEWRQGNVSVSRRGVLRGIHYALTPPGQAKYVSVVRGSVIDFVVDLRVGSPTFGTSEAVRLDDVGHKALYLAEGLGHGFLALEDHTTISYLVSEVFSATSEFAINPLDPELDLPIPEVAFELVLSARDEAAPSLAEARDRGQLPEWMAAP